MEQLTIFNLSSIFYDSVCEGVKSIYPQAKFGKKILSQFNEQIEVNGVESKEGIIFLFFYQAIKHFTEKESSVVKGEEARNTSIKILKGTEYFQCSAADVTRLFESFSSIKNLEEEELFLSNTMKISIKNFIEKNIKSFSQDEIDSAFSCALQQISKKLNSFLYYLNKYGVGVDEIKQENSIYCFARLLAIALCERVESGKTPTLDKLKNKIIFSIKTKRLGTLLHNTLNDDLLKKDAEVELLEQTITSLKDTALSIKVENPCKEVAVEQIATFLKENNRIIIVGEGGLGKSVFLKNITNMFGFEHPTYFGQVVYVPLSTITEKGKSSNLPFSTIDDTFIFSAYTNTITSSITQTQFEELMFHANDKFSLPIMFIFDGLNEVPAKFADSVLQEIKALSYRAQNSTIIVSTRKDNPLSKDFIDKENAFDEFSLSGTPPRKVKALAKKLPLKNDILTELIKIPLYYNLLEGLYSDKNDKNNETILNSKYSVLQEAYIKYAKGHTNITTGSSSHKLSCLNFIYFYIFPLLAYNTGYCFNKQDIKNVVESAISNANCMSVKLYNRFQYLAGRFENINEFESYDIKEILEILYNENWLNVIGANSYAFKHQDWHDFLSAFYISEYQTIFLQNYKDENLALDTQIDFKHLPSTAMELYGEKFKLNDNSAEDESPQKNVDRINKNILDLFSEFNNVSKNPFEITLGELKVAELIYLLSEYKGNLYTSDYKETFKKILDKIVSPLLSFKDFGEKIKKHYELVLNNEIKNSYYETLTNILIKRIEIARIDEDFNLGLQLSDVAILISDRIQIKHQKAKLLMFRAQKTLKSTVENESDAIVEFKEGYNLLKECGKTYIFSKNLLAFMKSFPAPWLLKNNIIDVDYCESFRIYYDAVFLEISPDDKNYAYREMIHLILNGYVKFQDCHLDFSTFQMRDDLNVTEGDGECNEYGYEIIKQILTLFGDSNYKPLINYYRGVVKLHENEIDKAKEFFLLEKKMFPKSVFRKNCPVLSDLMLRKCGERNENKAVLEAFEETLKDNIISEGSGSIDKTHTCYILTDVKYAIKRHSIRLTPKEQEKYEKLLKLSMEVTGLEINS